MPSDEIKPDGSVRTFVNNMIGTLVMRPWFDAVAVRAVMNWYLPLSRAWAAGSAARGDLDRFADLTKIDRKRLVRLVPALTQLNSSRRLYDEAKARWEEAYFSSGDIADTRLIVDADARLRTATDYMMLRRQFLSVRRLFPQVDWSIASPKEVFAVQGERLKRGEDVFPAPIVPSVEVSKFASRGTERDGWLRMPSPSSATNDTAWAHVFWPEGKVRGTILSLHGVLMEQDMWPVADPVSQLVKQGFCVIRPEGPWHGRRCPTGQYGGEAVFARGILGFIELFDAWVAEVALWINWARAEIGGRVGLSGISLGALTSQLVVANCGGWPRDMQPDAVLLITTTGDVANGALRGSLANMLNMRRRLSDEGWQEGDIASWSPLIEPGDKIALDPDSIVMALGDADTVTPYEGGKALAARWRVPAENLLVKNQGHFSTTLGLHQDQKALLRLADVLTR